MSRTDARKNDTAALLAEASGRRDLSAAHRKAVRHSRVVWVLRRLLPTIAVLVTLFALFSSWFDPFRFVRELPIEFARLSLTGNKLKMETPKLSGFTREGRAFTVTAESAAQDLGQPNVIELSGILARFEVGSSGPTTLAAKSGHFEAKADKLRLFGGIDIESVNGYSGRLNEALVNVRTGHVVSEDPVDFRYRDGWLRAKRLEIFDNGARAVFEGDVNASFMLPPAPARPNEAKK